MNNAFTSLLNEKIELFKHSFSVASRRSFADPETGALHHAGEFGTYREAILRDFLRMCIPANLDIGTGFLITATGAISTQMDVVIYEKSAIPRIESVEHQRFFPVEGVCAIGEVKSRMSKSTLKAALNKLAQAKSKADEVSSTIALHRDRVLSQRPFDREKNEYDQIFSFLVCEGFDFDPRSIPIEISEWYESDIKRHHKHNMVLSVEDGLLLYVDEQNVPWMYPTQQTKTVRNRFVAPGENPMAHFHLFCTYMFGATSSTTILFPEMVSYMPNLAAVNNHDG
ncbi:hypothetical protein L0Z02_23735 [Burkholderia multivorans]|uniref:DUF6602 domain-containing protein n=1 Tax=Burkholderia multivorans TaxID=87883 RepID=UPI0020184908|nr:DUF6602 domain-containing protein [Burkholderia multivorans]MCO1454710.1 hypothetical protein [Burkholderia multivorans]UQO19172.1 hypothetical protein L0Z02_23735 [Burkholderia multivorans]